MQQKLNIWPILNPHKFEELYSIYSTQKYPHILRTYCTLILETNASLPEQFRHSVPQNESLPPE